MFISDDNKLKTSFEQVYGRLQFAEKDKNYLVPQNPRTHRGTHTKYICQGSRLFRTYANLSDRFAPIMRQIF